ncbi:DeoR/GlpR family DNA-binding transcription regulator [Schaalia vaccimaxillae]|uniref:DeoR/GlpR family DNA-binding transcription regulator n=1 Tax=Schaalia vaccimaxillae TaxID=183916 RepID=UPI0003B385E0|nr:DeoR/GlpR family DNA-binding transcription regulator [Schaalia vaccimaxillae]
MGKNSATAREKRHQALVDYISENGNSSAELLADELGVSVMTIYRDITFLESTGLVRREHGSVQVTAYTLAESSALMRSGRHNSAKSRLAAAALDYVHSGMSIALDDSTTLMHLFPEINNLAPLTVVTNSRLLADEVIRYSKLELIALGGNYVRWADAFSGPGTVTAMAELHPDLCIMSSTAVMDGQLAHPDPMMAAIKRQMLMSSRQRIVLVDRSKFTKSALHHFHSLKNIDVVITETSLPGAQIEALRAVVPEVVLV